MVNAIEINFSFFKTLFVVGLLAGGAANGASASSAVTGAEHPDLSIAHHTAEGPAGEEMNRCKALLLKVPEREERILQIRRTLDANLHWRGDRHLIFPARRASWDDINIAYQTMGAEDVPILVSLIGSGQLKGGLLSIAMGVLGRFGNDALPCIEAGIEVYRTQHVSDLLSIKVGIEAEMRSR